MSLVIAARRLDRAGGLLDRPECEQSVASRQVAIEPGVLRDDRAAGCEIADAPVAEPPAFGFDVAAFRDPELSLRTLNERPICVGRSGHSSRIHEIPPVRAESVEIRHFRRMDGECRLKPLAAAMRQRHEAAKRVGLLAVEHSAIFDRSISPPVADRRPGGAGIAGCHRPFGKNDRLESRHPHSSAGRDVAFQRADRTSDRREMRVPVEAHINALNFVPQLVEGRIEIQVDPGRDRSEQIRVRQHAGDVDQDVCVFRGPQQVPVRKTNALVRVLPQQGALHIEARHHIVKIRRVDRRRQRRPLGPARRRRDWLDEAHVVSETAQSQDVLKNGPRRAPLVRIAGDHAAQQDPKPLLHGALEAVADRELEPSSVQRLVGNAE